MTEIELLNWLKQQQPILDDIIAKAGRDFHDQNKSRSNFGFDLLECQVESYNLSRKPPEDLCYDRPNTPFSYSLWYHARRVNTFLSHFAAIIFRSTDPAINFFDLGAGTGAVQWGIGLIYHKMKDAGLQVPKIKIVNIDTSPFMLHYNRDYLWKHFKAYYTHCSDFDTNDNHIEYEINSWNNTHKESIQNPWITASYLFDISDIGNQADEYEKATLKGFKDIIDAYNPSKMLLLTSTSKEAMVNKVAKEFDPTIYLIEKVKNRLLFTGGLDQVNQFRRELLSLYVTPQHGYKEKSIGSPAEWHDISFVGTVISKRQQEMFVASDSGIKLYNTSIKVRRDVQLNDEQKKAARNINQPTVIIGPAGCGKSIVITERIYNIIEEHNYNPNLSILLTTFNKELLGQLSVWIADLLKPGSFTIKYDTNFWNYPDRPCKFYFTGSNKPNIRLLHFDMLPKFLGNLRYRGIVSKHQHIEILTSIINEVKAANGITDTSADDILNPDFLLEEYHRVIYGLQVGMSGAKEEYLSVSRKGRGKKLDRAKREIVWSCLSRYARHIHDNNIPSFILRRQYFLAKLKNNQVNFSYDYVVVDEFQDCTKADFEIFFSLLNNSNNLVISGDLAQAVQLGKSANVELLREAIREGRTMNDISWNYLEGSYRLPFRICESIRKISEFIHSSFRNNRAASVLTPYKGAPPGARPIIVYSDNEEEAAKKLQEILKAYSVFELEQKCILESDSKLSKQLGIPTDSVLRLKGIEKHCVIWSTRSAVDFKREKFEFAYTILSRTSSILIIALFPNDDDSGQGGTQEIFKEIIGLLRKDRIILWDQQTKDNFASFCSQTSQDDTDEED